MMYIDTHSRESMENSMCDLFQMQQLELRTKLIMLDISACDDDDFDYKLDEFISENISTYPDEILLFHLTRRLCGTADETGRNLADLLLSENPFSSFMRDNGIEFSRGEHYIDVIYKGKVVDWNKCSNGNSSYMQSRLGYFEGREDFCFNGFAFKDLLYRNHYARDLSRAPEFLGQLVECLQCKSMEWTYMENSEYFCYEYKLPISLVMFDDHDGYPDALKQRYLVRCVLQRLYQYQTSDPRFMHDLDNPILRLADDYTIPTEYYIGREIITDEMMHY